MYKEAFFYGMLVLNYNNLSYTVHVKREKQEESGLFSHALINE